jgi:hypothetical protein
LREWQHCAAVPAVGATPGDLRKVFVPAATSVAECAAHGRRHAV